jgi:hypothetical protein
VPDVCSSPVRSASPTTCKDSSFCTLAGGYWPIDGPIRIPCDLLRNPVPRLDGHAGHRLRRLLQFGLLSRRRRRACRPLLAGPVGGCLQRPPNRGPIRFRTPARLGGVHREHGSAHCDRAVGRQRADCAPRASVARASAVVVPTRRWRVDRAPPDGLRQSWCGPDRSRPRGALVMLRTPLVAS